MNCCSSLLRWTFTSALWIGSAACSSTGVGNPGFDSQGLALTQDNEIEPGAEDTEQLEADTLKHAMLVFGELRIVPCDVDARERILQGPFVVDLLANTVEPELPKFEWPASGLCGIDAILAPATTPRSLQGRSMLFSGVRNGTLFVLVADMPGTLRMRPLPDLAWEPGQHDWIWALRPRRWLLPRELESEAPDTGSAVEAVADIVDVSQVDRVIAINVNRHPVLYEVVRTRLAARSSLHVDVNDDGRVDAAERRSANVIGRGLDDLD